ncbi:hypothetical protein [Streptomyces bicolor]|uniref:hypothetical protein n=1 Tax=Streptomyces bicolor TaxID=66874 RepID=UPI00131BD348|nr:hypothetical protein [Streptomyces bicolor]
MIKAAAFVGIVGLGSAGGVGTAYPPAQAWASAPTQMVTSTAPTVDLPAPDQLQSALLRADDLGPAFTQKPTTGPSPSQPEDAANETRFAGCQPLAGLLNGTGDDGRSKNPRAVAIFTSRDGRVAVYEALTAEPPAVLDDDYAQTKQALESCGSISLVSAGQTIKFSLTPIRFGGPDSSAVRMDATHQGVLVNGYIAIERLGESVALAYAFFQVGGGSSQLASHFYQRAADKARTTLDL